MAEKITGIELNGTLYSFYSLGLPVYEELGITLERFAELLERDAYCPTFKSEPTSNDLTYTDTDGSENHFSVGQLCRWEESGSYRFAICRNITDSKVSWYILPTKVSELTNDAGYLTEHQDISGKVDKVSGKGLSTNDYTTTEKNKLAGIAEGATANVGTVTGITMNGASKGTSGVIDLGTVITAHQDISGKVDKVSGKGLSTNDYTTTEKNKLAGIASGAEVNVQSDWSVTDTTSDAYIKNKPTIPSAVSESTVSGWGFTKNTGTITGIKMNGSSKGSSGVVDLGTVITSHQDISGKLDVSTAASTYATKTALSQLQTQLDTIVGGDASTAIESFNEIVAFLEGVEDTETLEGVIAGINTEIAKKADKSSAITSISRNGTTFTATRADGTTFTFSQQDNNTTYTFAGGTNQFTVTPSGGTAQTITVTPSIGDASTSASGLMSASDKSKLDGIASGANKYSLPEASSTLGGVKTTSTVTSTSGLTATPIISGVPYYKDTTYSAATTSAAGLMSASDKTKLNGIATGAEVNVQSDWSVTDTSSDAYIKNKPTIPSAVSESTVSGWGFTKNTGTYSKPSSGIPKSDLASSVQTSLGKADSALQSYTETDPVFKASAAAGIKESDITNWNGKTSNTGTVTSVETGIGLTGGAITGSGTIKTKLRSETALTLDSSAATTTSNRVYPVAVDKSGYLAVNVPWTDTKVTAVANHYTPSGGTTTSASGGTLTDIANSTSGVQVVTGVTKDNAGHITGITSVALKSSNTTYSSMSESEANTGTATTGRVITAQRLHNKINKVLADGIFVNYAGEYVVDKTYPAGAWVKFGGGDYIAKKSTSLPPIAIAALSSTALALTSSNTYALMGGYEEYGNKSDWFEVNPASGSVKRTSASVTLAKGDQKVICSNSSAITVTLPLAPHDGCEIWIIARSGNVTVSPSSGNSILGGNKTLTSSSGWGVYIYDVQNAQWMFK